MSVLQVVSDWLVGSIVSSSPVALVLSVVPDSQAVLVLSVVSDLPAVSGSLPVSDLPSVLILPVVYDSSVAPHSYRPG